MELHQAMAIVFMALLWLALCGKAQGCLQSSAKKHRDKNFDRVENGQDNELFTSYMVVKSRTITKEAVNITEEIFMAVMRESNIKAPTHSLDVDAKKKSPMKFKNSQNNMKPKYASGQLKEHQGIAASAPRCNHNRIYTKPKRNPPIELGLTRQYGKPKGNIFQSKASIRNYLKPKSNTQAIDKYPFEVRNVRQFGKFKENFSQFSEKSSMKPLGLKEYDDPELSFQRVMQAAKKCIQLSPHNQNDIVFQSENERALFEEQKAKQKHCIKYLKSLIAKQRARLEAENAAKQLDSNLWTKVNAREIFDHQPASTNPTQPIRIPPTSSNVKPKYLKFLNFNRSAIEATTLKPLVKQQQPETIIKKNSILTTLKKNIQNLDFNVTANETTTWRPAVEQQTTNSSKTPAMQFEPKIINIVNLTLTNEETTSKPKITNSTLLSKLFNMGRTFKAAAAANLSSTNLPKTIHGEPLVA